MAILFFSASVLAHKFLGWWHTTSPKEFKELQEGINWQNVSAAAKSQVANGSSVSSICASAFFTITSSTKERLSQSQEALGVITYFYSTKEYSETDFNDYKRSAGEDSAATLDAIWQLAISLAPNIPAFTASKVEIVAEEMIDEMAIFDTDAILTNGNTAEAHQEIIRYCSLPADTDLLTSFFEQDNRDPVRLGNEIFKELAAGHGETERLIGLLQFLIEKGLYRKENYDASSSFEKQERFDALFPRALEDRPAFTLETLLTLSSDEEESHIDVFNLESILTNNNTEEVFGQIVTRFDPTLVPHQSIVLRYLATQDRLPNMLGNYLVREDQNNGWIHFLIEKGLYVKPLTQVQQVVEDIAALQPITHLLEELTNGEEWTVIEEGKDALQESSNHAKGAHEKTPPYSPPPFTSSKSQSSSQRRQDLSSTTLEALEREQKKPAIEVKKTKQPLSQREVTVLGSGHKKPDDSSLKDPETSLVESTFGTWLTASSGDGWIELAKTIAWFCIILFTGTIAGWILLGCAVADQEREVKKLELKN